MTDSYTVPEPARRSSASFARSRLVSSRTRLLRDGPGPGARQMATDELMMERAAITGNPIFRIYRFAPATLSVGRFQPLSEVDAARAVEDGLTVVRRPTGGRAVLHTGELTYAVAIGRDHVDHFTRRGVFRMIGDWLLEALARIGVDGRIDGVRHGSPADPDCFSGRSELEVAAPGGLKLVGSAQAAIRGAVLQHGSIPLDHGYRAVTGYLRTSPSTAIDRPEVSSVSSAAGLSHIAGRRVSFGELETALTAVIMDRAAGSPSELDAAERERVDELERDRYRNDDWTARR